MVVNRIIHAISKWLTGGCDVLGDELAPRYRSPLDNLPQYKSKKMPLHSLGSILGPPADYFVWRRHFFFDLRKHVEQKLFS